MRVIDIECARIRCSTLIRLFPSDAASTEYVHLTIPVSSELEGRRTTAVSVQADL